MVQYIGIQIPNWLGYSVTSTPSKVKRLNVFRVQIKLQSYHVLGNVYKYNYLAVKQVSAEPKNQSATKFVSIPCNFVGLFWLARHSFGREFFSTNF